MHVAVGRVVELDEGAMKAKPLDLKAIHKTCFKNLETVGHATQCACFYCYGFFVPGDIKEWVDEFIRTCAPERGAS